MVIKVNLLYLCQILKFHNFNFYMTGSLDILIPVFNEDQEINKTLALLLNNVKCDNKLNICYDYDKDPTLDIIKKKFPFVLLIPVISAPLKPVASFLINFIFGLFGNFFLIISKVGSSS